MVVFIEVNTGMKKISYEEAKKRFLDQGRQDIELIETGYVSWKCISLFFDKVHGDYFKSIPKNVYVQRSCHPSRSIDNRKKTNMMKYGNISSLHGEQVKEKVKKTLMDRYGVEHGWKSDQIRKKSAETIKERYGVENISQSEEIKTKKKETTQKNYGVEYPSQNTEIIKKQKETCFQLYGVEHASQLQEVKEKVKETLVNKYGVTSPFQLPGIAEKSQQTCVEKYGKPYFSQAVSKVIVDCIEQKTIIEWWKSIKDIKPSYSFFWNHLKNEDNVTYKMLNDLLESFKLNKTSLEKKGEDLFECSHFNQKVCFDLNYKPDFKLSNHLFVNVDGLYWHSELKKDKKYHWSMREKFEAQGLSLLQFYEDEIKTKPEIVKSLVNNRNNKTTQKIFARKTTIKDVGQKEADLFLNNNHLMGTIAAKHIGLYFDDQLVTVLSYKVFKAALSCHVERFCSLCNVVVVGAFSKLLTALQKRISAKEYMYWVDLRYGTGSHLIKQGFCLERETLGWKWTNGVKTFNRLRCRANMDSRKLSEKEYAEEFGWYKIYDAGQRLYVLKS